MRLFRSLPTSIGVDLGTSSVKVVELVRDRENVALTTYALAPQPNLLIESGGGDAVASMAVLVREMFARANVGAGKVATALPVLSVFSTVLELPAMPERDLESAVMFAAKNYVPSVLSDVVVGWVSIGGPQEAGGLLAAPRSPALTAPRPPVSRSSAAPPEPPSTELEAAAPVPTVPEAPAGGESEEEKSRSALTRAVEGVRGVVVRRLPQAPQKPETRKSQEVFLTAAPRDLVTRYTALFERLDIELATLEIESFPLARSLLVGETRPVMIVDFGDRTTSFSVVDEDYLRVNQAVDIGGSALTAAVGAKLSVSHEEAERRKRQEGVGGVDVASPTSAALRPVLSELVGRAESLRRLYERKRNRPLGRVILIGGGALLPGLAPFWTSATGLPSEVGNPWRSIAIPQVLIDRLRELGSSFAVAVGLALHAFEARR